jgi:hypothetical protein
MLVSDFTKKITEEILNNMSVLIVRGIFGLLEMETIFYDGKTFEIRTMPCKQEFL